MKTWNLIIFMGHHGFSGVQGPWFEKCYLVLTLTSGVTLSKSFAIVGSLYILPTQTRMIWATSNLGR